MELLGLSLMKVLRKMGLPHAEVVNDGGTVDEKVAVKMDIERHVVRGSVAEAGGNRKMIIQTCWGVLPIN